MRQIAQVLKSNGTDGELVFGFHGVDPDDISTTEPLFIYFDGLPVPFFIEKITRRGLNKALIRLTDIDCFQDSEEIVGCKVYSDSFEEEEDDLSVLVGWTLFSAGEENEEPVEVGKITEFIDIANNPCIETETKNGAAIIPLHEDFIISIDPESREIVMNIPDGLI